MSKVTYEMEMESVIIWGHKFTRKEFDNLVASLNPPSFNEVVKAWEELGYRITANKSSAHVMKGYEDVYTIDKLGLFSETKRISYEKLNAINLTIRYLEREK